MWPAAWLERIVRGAKRLLYRAGRCHRRAVVAAWRKHPVTNSPGVNLDVRSAPAGRARIPTGQIDSRFRHLGRQPLCAFAADAQDLNLSHNLPQDCAVYTGTHDNEPSRGWFAQTAVCERDFARTYLRCDGTEISRDLSHAASAATARDRWQIDPHLARAIRNRILQRRLKQAGESLPRTLFRSSRALVVPGDTVDLSQCLSPASVAQTPIIRGPLNVQTG